MGSFHPKTDDDDAPIHACTAGLELRPLGAKPAPRFSATESVDCSGDVVAFCGALVEVVPGRCGVEELHEAEPLEFSQTSRDVRPPDRLDRCVELRGCQLLLQREERALTVTACPHLPDEVPRGCHLVPDDTRVLYRGVANSCHVV